MVINTRRKIDRMWLNDSKKLTDIYNRHFRILVKQYLEGIYYGLTSGRRQVPSV